MPTSTLKKKKNCSRNIWFSYLLNSFGKRMRFLGQNWLCSVLRRGVGNLTIERTM